MTARDKTGTAAGGDQAGRLSDVLQLSAEGVLVVSEEGEILFANPASETLLGAEPGEAVGQQFGFPAATEAPTIVMLRRPGQAPVRVEMRSADIEWADRQAYVINLHDITQRAVAFEKAQRLAAIVESSDDAIYGKDLDGIVTSWNAGAERIFGYTAEEIIGCSIEKLVPEELASEEPRLLAKIGEGERIDQYETVRCTKSGERRYVSLTISPLRCQNEDITGASTVARDVTEAHHQREKLQQRTYDLQERVKEQACMYTCCKAANEAMSLADLVRSVAEAIPDGYQFPDLTHARIQLDDHEAATEGFKHTPWRLREDIRIDGKVVGCLEVVCDEARGGAVNGAFLAEEQTLLASISGVLSQTYTRITGHLQNLRLNEVLRAIQSVNQLIVRETGRDRLIRQASDLLVESKAFDACWLVLMEDGRVDDYAYSGLTAEDVDLLLKHFDQGDVPVCATRGEGHLCRVADNLGEACDNCPLRSVQKGKPVLTAALRHQDSTYGFIAVYVAEYVVDDSREVALVEEVADDLALALSSMEMREQVAAAAKRNKEILSSISDAFFAIDDDLVVTYFNPAAERILGRSADEVLGRPLFEAFPEAKGSIFESHYQRAIKAHESDHFEVYFPVEPYDDWYDVRVYPQAKGLSIYFQVTTERKEAEEALRRSLKLLNQTGDIARIGGWEIDLETDTVIWTRTTRELHEVDDDYVASVEDAIGFFAPDVQDTLAEAIERARTKGIPYDLELPFITAEGRHLWTRTVGVPEMEDGRCVRLHGIFQDITERKQHEEDLRESKLRLEAALEAGRIGLWDWDVISNEVDFSPEWTRQIGYAADEIDGQFEEWKARVHPDDLPAVLDYINRVLQSDDEMFEVEFRFRHKDGSYRHILSQATIFRDESGKPLRVLGAHSDITDLRAAEQEQSRLQEELQQAQKMDSVGRLAGGVAHDFNNKLSVIIGFTQLAMLKLSKEDPLHKRLDQISTAAESAADLTRQLLAFARKQTIDPKALDLNDLVSSMLKMLGRLIGEDINLVWEPHSGLWPIKMDPGQVDQILANLVVNARDAIGGVGTVRIRTTNADLGEDDCHHRPDAVPGQYVCLSVADTGCGIEPEVMDHIFEPFYTTKAQGEGTGLGLATVYGAVRQNDGFIEVSSELEHGTTFHIYLPRLEGVDAIDEAGEETVDIPAGNETILLVEDDPPVLELALVILEEFGYTVLAAETPTKALKVARQHQETIDMLLTDVVMPEMNGKELCQELHKLIPDLKCLFMSGYTADVIANRGVLEKDVRYLQKPFQAHELGQKVRELLDH